MEYLMPSKGSPQVETRVDPVLKRYLEAYAAAHGTTPSKLTRDVISEWVYDRIDTSSNGVGRSLHKMDVLLKRLQLKVAILAPAGGEDSAARVYDAGRVRVPGGKKPAEPPPAAPAEPSSKATTAHTFNHS
jgi:hypothetical protein